MILNITRSMIFYVILNILIVLLLSPFFMTLIKKIKALVQGRRGPGLMQGYYNLFKLMKKEVVYSDNSSWIMRFTPYINIIILITAILFIPIMFIPSSNSSLLIFGNMIIFLYLLALAKFFMALGGLDAGSAFGGMSSSREMTISAIIEPVTIIVFASLAFVFKTTNFFEVFTKTNANGFSFAPAIILVSISFFIVLITETARVPVDNPETHLELTMIHEGMILEQAGRNLAFMEISHAIKHTLFMAILINLLLPWGIATSISASAISIAFFSFLIKGSILAIFIALFESSFAKLRLFQLPNLFLIAFFLSLLTILFEVFI